jgi:hypothetical protein
VPNNHDRMILEAPYQMDSMFHGSMPTRDLLPPAYVTVLRSFHNLIIDSNLWGFFIVKDVPRIDKTIKKTAAVLLVLAFKNVFILTHNT